MIRHAERALLINTTIYLWSTEIILNELMKCGVVFIRRGMAYEHQTFYNRIRVNVRIARVMLLIMIVQGVYRL
jgi:hypothetical protein